MALDLNELKCDTGNDLNPADAIYGSFICRAKGY